MSSKEVICTIVDSELKNFYVHLNGKNSVYNSCIWMSSGRNDIYKSSINLEKILCTKGFLVVKLRREERSI